MTLLFCDGFDHYNTLPGGKWNGVGANAPVIGSQYARTGGGGMFCSALKNNCYVLLSYGNKATIYLGFALKVQTIGAQEEAILYLMDGGTNSQSTVTVTTTGSFRYYRNGTVTFLGAGSLSVQQGAWAYIEVMVTTHISAGAMKLRVNGVQDPGLNLTGIDNSQTGNAWTNGLQLGQMGFANPDLYFDDFVLMDTNGSVNNNFLGDTVVEAVLPNANGSENDFSMGGSSLGTQNYQQVNENPPNDDTSYVSSPTVGNIDRYLYPGAVPTTGTPYAVVVWNRARKDDVGGRLIRAAVKSGGTVSDNGTDLAMGVNYQYLMGLFENDPNTSAPWTLPAVNAAEFGVKVTG